LRCEIEPGARKQETRTKKKDKRKTLYGDAVMRFPSREGLGVCVNGFDPGQKTRIKDKGQRIKFKGKSKKFIIT